ncbi:MAG: UDP-3-O-[3-hydroxymyristoyl] N-acetylglucosamine deacetylase [Candidatus Omnitrophica bacterium]|nr:UDP-3-O-[3-hydroxymyristoyl] N-acetylglucosamine deacetylase [Candidatus Omnitrophota bacterium]
MNQHTIKSKLLLEGVGLHTGEKTKIELLPAPVNTGIIFLRQDNQSSLIKADVYSVLDTNKFPRRTAIGAGSTYVQTVEHLMAALHILSIDNVQINMWGEEIPGLDGSAKDFVEGIKKVGICEQDELREYVVVKEPLWAQEGDCRIVVLPSPELRISYGLAYDNSLIGSTYMDLTLDEDNNFYQARTFCLQEEAQALLDMGLGKGSNHKNTLVVSEKGVVENSLRFPDEFIKHKVLDLIGDLYLAGPIKAHIIAIKSGHSLNIKLLQKIRKYQQKSRRAGVGLPTSTICDESELNIEEIMQILPHRFPFLLVDRITYLEKGKKAIGIKNVTMNEHFFQGHFPGRPVMPGVLMVEAMAQVGGIVMLACEEHRGKLAYFMAANNIKFRKTVEPGDQLVFEVVAGKVRKKTGKVYAKTFVNDKVVAEGELMFAIVE